MNQLFPPYTVSYDQNKIFEKIEDSEDQVDLWHDVYGNICAKSRVISDNYLFYLIGFGYFLYEINTDKLTIHPDKEIVNQNIQEVYYRIFLPLLLHIKGFESIHSSGIETEAGVIAFAGYSGAGKSTIVHEFSKRGYKPWADDCITILKNSDDLIFTLKIPFTLRLKEYTGEKEISYKNSKEGINKTEKKRLLMIIELTKTGKPDSNIDVKKLAPKDSLAILLRHTYYCSLYDKELKARMFRNFSSLANKLPVYKVQYPDNKKQLSNIVDELERILPK